MTCVLVLSRGWYLTTPYYKCPCRVFKLDLGRCALRLKSSMSLFDCYIKFFDSYIK